MDINPNWIVNGGLLFAGAYIFLEWWPTGTEGMNKLFPIAALAAAMYFFNNNFIDKAKLKKAAPEIGTAEPYNPNTGMGDWEMDEKGQPKQVQYPPERNIGGKQK